MTLAMCEMLVALTDAPKPAQRKKYISGQTPPAGGCSYCKTCLWAGCECQGMSAYQGNDGEEGCATFVYYD